MVDDALVSLLDLPGVPEAVSGARHEVDRLLWDRAVGRATGEVVAESALRGAWANAWFDGVDVALSEVRSGAALDGSPMGRVLAGTVAMHAELPGLVAIAGSAPAQALARMHSVLAHGFVPDRDLGRPRQDALADDPLRLGPPPDAGEVGERLGALPGLMVSSSAPGVLVAAVAHAEVAVLRPFAWGSGLVARALPRLILAQRGIDPSMLGAPEVGLRVAGRPAYVRALRAYGQGTPQGVARMVVDVAEAIGVGARQPGQWLAGG